MTPIVLVLDPGHGGTDPGCVWPIGAEPRNAELVEADVALNLALGLRQAIEGTGWPVACELTRDEDEHIDLDARGALSDKLGADFVLSIHVNAANEPAHGAMAFGWYGNELAADVGSAILHAMPIELRRANCDVIETAATGWTDRAHHVLRVHRAPALLIEVGFATNAKDRARLLSLDGQAEVIAALLAGVARLVHLLGGRS